MGRKKVQQLRETALKHGWLLPEDKLPENEELATVISGKVSIAVKGSSVVPYAQQVKKWHELENQGTIIHQALVNKHGFTGSY